MSFEEMGSTKHPCPCGKGTYTYTWSMDDWNRTESEKVMNCKECKKNYVLDEYDSSEKGISSTSTRWIRRDISEKAEALIVEAECLQDEAKKLASKLYLEKWMDHFKEIGDKKGIWAELTGNGKRYPSLGTFYKHLKNQTVDSYLKNTFESASERLSDFVHIQKILNVKDTKVVALLKKSNLKLEEASVLKANN
jgi:hypothetical protein